MVPLEALTYVCWIQFKIMLFAYVSGHTKRLLLVYVHYVIYDRCYIYDVIYNSASFH